MKEIGGYIELDTYRLPMLHEKAIKLNCGRNALWYLIKARNIRKIWILFHWIRLQANRDSTCWGRMAVCRQFLWSAVE